MISASSIVILLSVLVAVTWGFSPIMEKKGLSMGGKPVQASLIFVLISVFVYWLSLLLIDGFDAVDGVSLYSIAVFGVAGIVGTSFGRIAVFEGVKRVGPSVNGAGISVRPVFSAFIAWVWLGEELTTLQFVGISTLVAGLILVSISDGGDVSGWNYMDLAFPVGGAFLFASGFVIRRFGLLSTSTTPLQAVAINETAALLPLIFFFILSDDASDDGNNESNGDTDVTLHRSYVYFGIAGVIAAVGLLAFFVALSIPEGKVAIVDPIAAVAPVFTVIFSYFLLNDLERVTRRLIVGLLLTVLGAALVGV